MLAEFVLIGWFVVFIYTTQIKSFGNGFGELFNLTPLQPFRTAFRYGSNNAGMVWQILLNILMFVPLGFLLPIVFPCKCAIWPKVLSVSFFASLATELLQLISMRGTDIDDIIANTVGGLCGFALFLILREISNLPKRRNEPSPHRARNLAASFAVLLAQQRLSLRWIFRTACLNLGTCIMAICSLQACRSMLPLARRNQ